MSEYLPISVHNAAVSRLRSAKLHGPLFLASGPVLRSSSNAENASGHHNFQNTFKSVVSNTASLESDLKRLDRFARHLEAKCIPPELRTPDLEVAAQPGLVAFEVEETAIVGFELALNQKIGTVGVFAVLAFLAFRKRDLEVLTTRTCD